MSYVGETLSNLLQANRGIPVLDIGVPVLSMHSPFEVIHKSDLYMAYRAFSLFNNAQ